MKSLVKALLVALAPLAAAVITVLTVFSIVNWSAPQTALVTTEALSLIGLLSAVVAHFWRGTAKEPVALAATFTAALSATIALGTGFAWWCMTAEQTTAVVSLVTAIAGVGTAVVARGRVDAAKTRA